MATATRTRGILPPRRYWLKWEEEFLRTHYADSLNEDLAKIFGRSAERVAAKANAMGLHKSHEFLAAVARERSARPGHPSQGYRFQKGVVPANKGVKHAKGWAPGRMAESQFKPGMKPHTWVPVGSFRISTDGVLERKYSDNPGGPRARWRNYAALVWEAEHGPVPAGHIVVFRPGQKTTAPELVTLERLECISRADNVRRNSVHHLPQELKEIVRLRANLTRAINTKAREGEKAEAA